jgi:hypothetical protein
MLATKPPLHRHHVSHLPAGRPRRDPLADLVAERAHRIIGTVHLAADHHQVLMR